MDKVTIAEEMRTANMIAFLATLTPTERRDMLGKRLLRKIAERLG